MCRIRLFLSAEAEPFELFEKVVPHDEAEGRNDDDLVVDDNLGALPEIAHLADTVETVCQLCIQWLAAMWGPADSNYIASTTLTKPLASVWAGFTKDRTISRLIEMQSREYLTHHAEAHAPELLLALYDRKANPKSQRRGRHERGGLRSSTEH